MNDTFFAFIVCFLLNMPNKNKKKLKDYDITDIFLIFVI